MDVITIESKAFNELKEKLEAVSSYIYSLERPVSNEEEEWVDGTEVCQFLRICDRTLQRLRSKGIVPYSTIGGKNYYQISQLRRLLKERLIKSTDECFQELIEQHRQSTYGKKKNKHSLPCTITLGMNIQ